MSVRLSLAIAGLAAMSLLGACRRHREPPRALFEPAGRHAPSVPVQTAVLDPYELVPGSEDAFGLPVPRGATTRFSSEDRRFYFISSELPRVSSFYQARVDAERPEVMPVATMYRGVRVKGQTPAQDQSLDLLIRQESGGTTIAVWRHRFAGMPGATMEEGLRAAGFDPVTKRAVGSQAY